MYAALELRCCIERTLFEYLVLMKRSDLPGTMEKLYRAKDLKKTILEEDPDFLKKVEFMNLLIAATGAPVRMVIPDLDRLGSLYGQLNDYLHAPKRPEETAENDKWWTRLRTLVSDGVEHLKAILSQPVGYIDLNESGWASFGAWKRGEKTDAEIMEDFRLLLKLQDNRG